jgi:hypothetical protein
MAKKISPCRECGVPLQLSKSNKWHSDGTVTVSRDPRHRLLFCESDILDGLFRTIRDVAGSPIDQIIQDSKCKTARWYMEKRIPTFLSRLAYTVSPKSFAQFTADLTRVMGFGSIKVGEIKKGHGGEDLVRVYIQYPYSLPLILGDIRAGLETGSGRDCTITCRPIEGEEDLYVADIYAGTRTAGREERDIPERPPRKAGDVGYRRCPVCLVPLEITEYRWDLGRGTILHPETGRRVSIVSPDSLEYVIGELENRLGESIPDAVIEAMRLFSRTLFARELQARIDEEGLRRMLALRGFGILASFSLEGGMLEITVRNPCVSLAMVGLAKGVYEAATGNEGTSHTWSLGEDGDLSITISPA